MTRVDQDPVPEETGRLLDFEAALDDALQAVNDPESHVERDAHTFHPSQIARCERRCYCSKLGLEDQSDILGIFQTGTLIHEFIEDHVAGVVPDRLRFEHDVEFEVEGIRFVGRADCYDPQTGVVYDFKSRNGWYNFDPPTQRHLDQLYIYMAALDADHGQVVYVSKSDLEVRTWPADDVFAFDEDRFAELVAKAQRIKTAIEDDGIAASAEEIPFERCGCYFCDNESLQFEEVTGDV